jgi:hypothetical protein
MPILMTNLFNVIEDIKKKSTIDDQNVKEKEHL